MTAVNSEEKTSHSISIYDGDNAEKVTDRIRRVAGILGQQTISMHVYAECICNSDYLYVLILVILYRISVCIMTHAIFS